MTRQQAQPVAADGRQLHDNVAVKEETEEEGKEDDGKEEGPPHSATWKYKNFKADSWKKDRCVFDGQVQVSHGSEGTRSTICDTHECQYKTVYILVHSIGICIYMSQ